MYQYKLMNRQLAESGVRLGDGCSIFPIHGRKKAFTLNRKKIDLISGPYRPPGLALSYIELPGQFLNRFHYRLELEDETCSDGRFVLKTLEGKPFLINGLAAKEAYIERQDRLFIDDNKINFTPDGLSGIVRDHFEHPVLSMTDLVKSELKILIQGETGTGKTYLAQKIHEKSGRRGSFISLNLSSFNPQLIESELFGHKKGSFTGATCDKIGAVEQAQHGTLFLDEVDSLPIELQTKLLTFLDNQKYRRVGDSVEREVHSRLIFASGKSLPQLIAKGLFRQDFFFRLQAGHTIELESLRNNINRIKEACQHFALKKEVSLSPKLIDFYQSLAWPGNLRQLYGHLDKKRILSRSSKLEFDHLDEELLKQSSDLQKLNIEDMILPLEIMKTDYIQKILKASQGNIALTARRLKITEKTVKNAVKKSTLAS
jgi:transcriptional regulator with GAF, ATPase, and Fis domain